MVEFECHSFGPGGGAKFDRVEDGFETGKRR